MAISAREGTGLESWLRHIQASEPLSETAMDVDYELYAEGEALLGWLNATVELKSTAAFNGNEWIKDIALKLQQQLKHKVKQLKNQLHAHNHVRQHYRMLSLEKKQ